MPDDSPTPPLSSIILYQTEDGRIRIEVRVQDETVWLTCPARIRVRHGAD